MIVDTFTIVILYILQILAINYHVGDYGNDNEVFIC